MNKTLQDILEDWFTDKPEPIAEMELEDLLHDLEEAGAFRGPVRGAKDIMDNLKNA